MVVKTKEKNQVQTQLVKHLGIIMDGNRRWAKKRLLPSLLGHKKGYETFKKVAGWCVDRGIGVLTVYCFSTENWNRSEEEVNYLMDLFEWAFVRELKTFKKRNIQVRVIGTREKLPWKVLDMLDLVQRETADHTGGVLNLALNYGGRQEIIEGIQEILKEGYRSEEVTEEVVTRHLYTSDLPSPDLIIRTSGERRTSNFLLWQAAYAEWCFLDTLWPDFSEKDLDRALQDFANRKRRYGK